MPHKKLENLQTKLKALRSSQIFSFDALHITSFIDVEKFYEMSQIHISFGFEIKIIRYEFANFQN